MSQPERKLGTWPIFVIAVSAMTPLTVVAGALPLGYGQVGEKGIPVAYMLVAAVLGIFAVGLAAMARHVPNRGAFYAYAAIGISRPFGVGTAFVALLAYNAMQIGLYGAFGVAAHHAAAIFGLEVSWIVWALLGWVLISLLGRLDIDLNARILTVLVCAEVLIVLVFDAVMIGNPADGTVTFDTLNPALIASAGGVSLLVAAIAGMVGFEAPLVYASEARDPRRTVARAIGFTLLVAAFLYGGTAWAMSVVAGPDAIVAIAGQHLDDLFFFLPEPYLPTVIVDLGRIFFATSLFAAMLAFHHTVARYALTVAREGVLPAMLAITRKGNPVAASFAQSALSLVVLLIFAAAVWNPTTDLFFFGTVSGGLGVLILMTIASVAVVRFFRRNPRGESSWRRAIAPWIATVFLGIVLLLTVAFFGDLLGSENALKVWSPTLLYLLVLIAGIVWGRKLKGKQPEVYAVIGTGHPPLAPGETAPPVVTDSDPGEVSEGAARPVRTETAGGTSAAEDRNQVGTGPAHPDRETTGAAGEKALEEEAVAQAWSGPVTETEAPAVSEPTPPPRRESTTPPREKRTTASPEESTTPPREKPTTASRKPSPRKQSPQAGAGGASAGEGPSPRKRSPRAGVGGASEGGRPSPRKRTATGTGVPGEVTAPGTGPGEGSANGTGGVAPRIPRSRPAADDEPAGGGPAGPGARGGQRRAPRPRAPRPPEQAPTADTELPDDSR